MLQWMGGSRRKVTTSRKSTQKRQKQYFEQRKRQQEQTSGKDSYSDKTSTFSQHQNNNRSLDVLSLLNFSTVAPEHKSSCPSERESSEVDVMTLNYQTTHCSPTIQHHNVSPADPIGVKESRSSPDYQVETVYPRKVPISCSGSQNKALNGSGDNVDQLKTANNHQASVFDLLGDDGPNSNSEGNFVHEAHVAFSVEGIGKVETETPVHSPQQPGRTFSYGCSSPSKVTRRTHLSKKLYSELDDLEPEGDAMMQDIDTHFYESSFELPFHSREVMDSYTNPKQKTSTVKDFLQLNDNGSNLKNIFDYEETSYSCADKNEYTWNASSGFLEDNFLDEGECGLTWRNWEWQMNSNYANYLNIRKHEKPYHNFGAPHLKKKRACANAASRFKILESPDPYSKNQILESDYDFTTPHDRWHTSLRATYDVRDMISQPAWPSFVNEDAVESLSLLSEESCSSSAVRGEVTKKPPPNLMARQNMTKHGTNRRSFSSKCDVKNIYAQETHCKTWDNLRQWENGNGPLKYARMSNPSSPLTSTIFKKNIGKDDDWLFEEGYTTGNTNSGFDSFSRNSGTKLPVDFERFKCDVPAECPPHGSFFVEEPSFFQPFSESHAFETPIFPNIWPGSTNTLVQGSISKDEENKSDILPTVVENFEVQEDACDGSNGMSSENQMPVDALDSENSCSQFKEAKDGTQDTTESPEGVCDPEHAEETSYSVEIPGKFEGSVDEKDNQNGTQTSLPSPNGCTEIEDSEPKERNKESRGVSNGAADTSCQVKMLESYVLQLLCVQVLKEAATQGNREKA